MVRKGLRPSFRFGFIRPWKQARYAEVFPFRRSWPAILILLVLDIVFLIPAITTFREAISLWSQPDDLFNLVAALFISFWLLGWSIAPILLTLLLLALVFGRESVRAGPRYFEICLGLSGLGMAMRYDPGSMRNLRIEYPDKGSGKSWRGPHLAFDYGANSGEFGSDIDEQSLEPIRSLIETATGIRLREGEATVEELNEHWEMGGGEDSQKTEPVLYKQVARDDGVELTSGSTLALIAANMIPVAGTLFYGWELGTVLVLYWAESAIIGFYNLLKIAVIGRWLVLLAGPFFLGHFGGFMAGHFLFLYMLFVKGPIEGVSEPTGLGEVWQLFYALWPALTALFISHGLSFFQNFINRGEYRERTVKDQMSEPYSRIIFMHVVIIFGGGLTLVLGDATPVILLIIGLKILFDVRAHLKEHRVK